ncbi:MAG: DUF4349 domain-containing protein [Chloroflexota bacterium]
MSTNRVTPVHLALSICILGLLFLSACSAPAPAYYAEKEAGNMEAPVSLPAAPERTTIDLVSGGQAEGRVFDSGETTTQAVERLVIKNAQLSIVVDEPPTSMDRISRMADEMGGFVVSAQMYQTTLESGAQVPRASITIRVPAEKLNDALARIKQESDQDPLSENISSQDVTSEYTDLQSRLRNLQNTEAQLTKIMESATKTEDVLSVYSQLAQVREQIEVIQGQIKYYEQSAAMSAISVDLIANEAVQPLTIGGWQPVGVAKDAVQALINTLKFLANAFIWIVIFLVPVLVVFYLIFTLPVSLLWRAWRRRRARAKQAKQNDTASAPIDLQPPQA